MKLPYFVETSSSVQSGLGPWAHLRALEAVPGGVEKELFCSRVQNTKHVAAANKGGRQLHASLKMFKKTTPMSKKKPNCYGLRLRTSQIRDI